MTNYDKKKQQEIRHIFSDMGLCGCGTNGKYEILKALLERAEALTSDGAPQIWRREFDAVTFYEPLSLSSGEVIPGIAVEFFAHVMNSSKYALLDHGVSVGCSFLTDRGQVLLQFLRDFGSDHADWPDWWCSCDLEEEW